MSSSGDIAVRSEHSCTYLTQQQLALAPTATAVQVSKAKTSEVSGIQVEELIADLKGGVKPPGNSNRPVSDIWVGDTGYSIKTLKLKPARCRPNWQDWLGQSVLIPTTRIAPLGDLPKGKTPDTASPAAVGKRLIARYNHNFEQYGVENEAVLLRLRVEAEQLTRFYYWEHPIEALAAGDYRWSESERTTDDQWNRNLRAQLKGSADKAAAMTWNGVLWVRHQIPTDADTWVIPDCNVLTRDEASAAIAQAIQTKLMGR